MTRPPAKTALVSGQMSRMPRRDTGPEVAIRRALHAQGLRFRVHVSRLPGRPDIVFSRARLAVFVDGCFWHRCPAHGTMPKHNAEWWAAKLDRNVERDAEKDALLRAAGWEVLHIWEHEAPIEAVARIVTAYRAGLARRSASS